MRTSIGIDVDAPAALVFALARDVERWPRLLPHYERARVVDRAADGSVVAIFVARRPLVPLLCLGLPVAWRSRVRADAATRRLEFRHLGGATDGMIVTWRLEDYPGGCRVTIEHDFGPSDSFVARVRALVIDRLFVRPVASRTLATFRSVTEAASEALAEPTAEAVAETAAEATTDPSAGTAADPTDGTEADRTVESSASRIRVPGPERIEHIGPNEPTAATRSEPR